MSKNGDGLVTLYRDTFVAEEQLHVTGKSWREYLEETLADDFVLRRSDKTVPSERKGELLDRIASGPIRRRKVLEPVAWCCDSLGVVAGPIEMEIDGVTHRFQNVKVFERRSPDSWRCVYWQVTEMPVSSVSE
jgi:hypothetical protein